MDEVTGLPAGLTVQLSRGRVLPDGSAEADRWMRMLRDRHAECLATLDRERMAIEVVFRMQEGDGNDYLWWFTMQGADGASATDSPFAIDADHSAQARRTKEPGWKEAEAQVVFLPQPVREAIEGWSLRTASTADKA